MLSNMTNAFDADFECPAHIIGTLDFEYPPRSLLRDFCLCYRRSLLLRCFALSLCSHWSELLLGTLCASGNFYHATNFKVKLNCNLEH